LIALSLSRRLASLSLPITVLTWEPCRTRAAALRHLGPSTNTGIALPCQCLAGHPGQGLWQATDLQHSGHHPAQASHRHD
jgi:hypothetical protein